ncbi:BTAD domain-containing putative transcriptional regulator [Spongiactinospora sp. TRM90649]|uniref:AfsR/SARP family transcriptional regulator n=1 Tax=Spongiactinospora sp. TRM90649 TaxID=3031114 RepID=UPI0023F6EAE7|nr:BTAD domain-containing putative transcriptional regulator [Spongiactinospora sp. TRM90649]MDF5758453.1 BTAD domain-containing putative transcriptional regulator [Spongiactinospora sp. TRM90649]
MLAMLVVARGQVLSIDRLATAWGQNPPATVRNQVMIAVAALRRELRRAGAKSEIIRTEGSGYRLACGRVDTQDAEQCIELGRQAAQAGRQGEAAGLLGQALTLWRGPVLGDLELEETAAFVGRWQELRLAVLEERAELNLALGRHREVVGELSELLAEHPLRERVRGLLMTALQGSGRRSDALEVYREGRTLLADELGLDPGPELRRLEAAILADSADLGPLHGGEEVRQAPAELPADVTGFVGRERELDLLRRHAFSGEAPTVTTVTGAAGAGKTALAVRFGRLVAEEFPDGQLYVDLRGHAPRPPTAPQEALVRMLGSLGIPPERIPEQEEAAAALYRSRLSGRRVLVLLDDARTAEQVRPLLPGATGCLVLVTSRNMLAGLTVSHGARHLSLGVLDHGEGIRLLASVIGDQRLSAEPEAAERIVELCGHLPLALRVAAATLATRPRRSLDEYAMALSARGLDVLWIDGDVAVRAAFELSYAGLAEAERHVFRLLGLVRGPDITAPAVAALADVDTAEAERLLDHLAAAHLIEEHRSYRYACHDLLRQYAGELTLRDDGPAAGGQALQRLGDWYLTEAVAAAESAYPSITRLPPPVTSGNKPRAEAMAWLAAEQANLVAFALHAADTADAVRPSSAARRPPISGPRRHTWLIADALRGHFVHHTATSLADIVALSDAAVHAAIMEDDPLGLAAAHLCAGAAALCRARYAAARVACELAVQHSERVGWSAGAAAAHNNAAAACHDQGELTLAIDHLVRSMELNREIGDTYGEAHAMGNLGAVCLECGDLETAERHLRDALALHRHLRDSAVSHSLNELATVRRLSGDLDEALALATEALGHDRASGLHVPEAKSLTTLAEIHRDRRRLDLALEAAVTAGERAEGARHVYALCRATYVLGTVQALTGNHGAALDAHQQALSYAVTAGMRHLQVRPLLGLARAHADLGTRDRALLYARQALDQASSMGSRLLEDLALSLLADLEGEPWPASTRNGGQDVAAPTSAETP